MKNMWVYSEVGLNYCALLVYIIGGFLSEWDRGSTVVKVLCYKSEDRWFDPSGIFIDIKSFRSHYGPGFDSASNRNEYFLGVKAAGA